MNRFKQFQRRLWQSRLFFVAILPFIALGIALYLSQQHLLLRAEQLAAEDARVLAWWYEMQQETLNHQVTELAYRVSEEADFQQFMVDAGLEEHAGYLAWIGEDQIPKKEVNSSARVGDPATAEMFDYVLAIGSATTDLVYEDGLPVMMGMAPVGDPQGGGIIVMQQPIDEHFLDSLTTRIGYETLLYSFEEQQLFLSSNSIYISDPPTLDYVWMREVAVDRRPSSALVYNGQDGQILGVTSLSDFSASGYSGYLAIVESFQSIYQRSSLLFYLIVVGVLLLLAMIYLVWGYRSMLPDYFQALHQAKPKRRRGLKLRLAFSLSILVIPALVFPFNLIDQIDSVQQVMNFRSSRIVEDILGETFLTLARRVEHFSEDETLTTLNGLSGNHVDRPEAWTEQVRAAYSLDFVALFNDTDVVHVSDPLLSPEQIAQFATLITNQTDIIADGYNTLLVGNQTLPDGQRLFGGFHFGNRVDEIDKKVAVDLIVYSSDGADTTSLEMGQTETQTVHIIEPFSQILSELRIAIIRSHDTWHQTVQEYQTFVLGAVIIAAAFVLILSISIINQE